MGKRYHRLADYDEQKTYDDNDIFVLDDRPIKYDEKTGKIVRPDDPGYDDLPMIDRSKLQSKQDN